MFKLTLIVSALLATLVLSGVASAGTAARDPRVPALQRQVGVLSSQVSALQSQVRHDELDNICTWTYQFRINISVYNIFAAILGAAPYSGATPSDGGACAAVGRTPPSRILSGFSPLGLAGSLIGSIASQ